MIRPEFVILDDPSTRRSAMSPTQCQARLELINADVLAMAGPDSKIAAGACPHSDQGWRPGRRFADSDARRAGMASGASCSTRFQRTKSDGPNMPGSALRIRRGGNGSVATAYYLKNREPMDLGASAPWPARFLPDEVSAIESAMNLKIDDEVSFMSEYQGEPMCPDMSDSPRATPELIASRVNGIPRGVLPAAAEYLTGMIDVHDSPLYWCVVGGPLVTTAGFVIIRRGHSRISPTFPQEGSEHAGDEICWHGPGGIDSARSSRPGSGALHS